MPRVCVFDVNETLLDLSALDPHFARVFGDAAARAEWFTQLLQSALVATVTEAYADFSSIGRAALEMTAARRGKTACSPPSTWPSRWLRPGICHSTLTRFHRSQRGGITGHNVVADDVQRDHPTLHGMRRAGCTTRLGLMRESRLVCPLLEAVCHGCVSSMSMKRCST